MRSVNMYTYLFLLFQCQMQHFILDFYFDNAAIQCVVATGYDVTIGCHK